MCVRVCVHLFVQDREGCMGCCYNPDGLRLPVIQFYQGMMMSNDKHTIKPQCSTEASSHFTTNLMLREVVRGYLHTKIWFYLHVRTFCIAIQFAQWWSSQQSRWLVCARSYCRAATWIVLLASSALFLLLPPPPSPLSQGSWRACWRLKPRWPFTRGASLTSTLCWKASPSPHAATRCCSNSGFKPTT